MSPAVQAIVVAAIVAAAAAFIILRAVQSVRGRKPDCCTESRKGGCGSCSGCPGKGR